MGKISESMRRYLDSISDEQLQKDLEEVKEWNSVGPTIDEFLELFPPKIQNEFINNKQDNK